MCFSGSVRIDDANYHVESVFRSEPANKKFSVLFTSSASEFEPVSTERQELLEKLCSKGGWEKEYEWKQMQIFCADQEAMTLETDEAIRLENIHRNMKKTFIPNSIYASSRIF